MTFAPQALSTATPDKISGLPWYLRDLPKYLAAFAAMTVIYVGFRLYQGAFGVSAGLELERAGIRHALDATSLP